MGLDTARFVDLAYAGELTCTICKGIFVNPVQCGMEHIFCKECIESHVSSESQCPIEGHSLTMGQLMPAPQIVGKLMALLQIHCDNQSNGCEEVVRLSDLKNHLYDCLFARMRHTEIQTDLVLPDFRQLLNEKECLEKEIISLKRKAED